MKVRCGGCGKVVNVAVTGESVKCPACGYEQADTTRQISPLSLTTAQLNNTGKGQLPTEDRSARNVGCLIMGALLFGVPVVIGAMTGGDNAAYWVLAIGALIALIPLGVLFEKNTIRRK